MQSNESRPTGARLRQARETMGIKPEVLAVACGVSAATIKRVESGEYEPRLEHARRLAYFFGTTVDWLFPAPPEQETET